MLRSGPLGAEGGKDVDLAAAPGRSIPSGGSIARSASDDKAPIMAMLAALDALHAAGVTPSVNVKLFLEGEEEQGSPHLAEILRANAALLAADFLDLLRRAGRTRAGGCRSSSAPAAWRGWS